MWWASAMITSESHSHAIQGWPPIVNENESTTGTPPLCKMTSPVRMCQPVSESVRSQPTPVVDQNRMRMGSRKARSDSVGMSGAKRSSLSTGVVRYDCSREPIIETNEHHRCARPGTKLEPSGALDSPLRQTKHPEHVTSWSDATKERLHKICGSTR